jgi:hypothetical protein
MTRFRKCALVVAPLVLVALVAVLAAPAESFASHPCPVHSAPGWVGTTTYTGTMSCCCDGYTAGLYPSPRPVPQFVGHVFYTYEPLYPHHYLYKHRHHKLSYNQGNLTLTKVRYRTGFLF